MSSVKFNHSNAEGHQTISVFIVKDDGTSVQEIVTPSNPSFKRLAAYLIETPEADYDVDHIHGLVDPAVGIGQLLKAEFGDRVRFDNRSFYIEGLPSHNLLANQVRDMILAGEDDWQRLVRFLVNVEANPSRTVQERIWKWIERNGATITEDGRFMGYKGLTANLTSCAKGPNNFIDGVLLGEPDVAYHVPHRPGTVISKRRADVDDSGARCSVGLHVGAFGYASTFVKNHGTAWGNESAGRGSAMALVAVNPAHVVSIPANLDFKILVHEYEVTEILEDAEPVLAGKVSYDVQKTAVKQARAAVKADLALLDDEERETYEQARQDGASHAEALDALFPEETADLDALSPDVIETEESAPKTKVLDDWAQENDDLRDDLLNTALGHKPLARKWATLTTEASVRRWRKRHNVVLNLSGQG